MIGTVYGVKNLDTSKIEMVGSTVRSLGSRTAGYRRHEWFRNGKYELIAIRAVEHEDEEFFPIYLKAVENCEIARNHTWKDEGGRNQMAPLVQWMGSPMLESEKGKIGGKIGIRKMTKEIRSQAGKLGGKVSGKRASVTGQIQRAGVLGRKKNMENGQPVRLGKYNIESGHLARLRTPEHQSRAGRKGGLIGGKIQGRIQGPKNVASGLLKSVCVDGGRAASHARWHVKRSITNPDCALCVDDQTQGRRGCSTL